MSSPRRPLVLACMILALGPSACVKKSTYQNAMDALARSREETQDTATAMARRAADLQRQMEQANAAHEATEGELRSRVGKLEQDSASLDQLHAQAVTRFDQARAEVDRLETLLDRRGSEYRQLQQRLDQLGAVEEEVRERNRIYEEVIGKFKSLIDAGRLSVRIDRGRMVIQLPQDILFESGSATVGSDGRQTLSEVAKVLAGLPDRKFQVEGHTDNVPIATERFPSNWELSTGRALSVVRLLVQGGVQPGSLSGAGYGEYQPVASNDDAAGRRLNRRIEIVMLPNLDLIAGEAVPGTPGS
jgi:chemotaxis protein MotB